MGHLSITGQVQNVPINSESSRLLCWVGTSSMSFYRWGKLTHQETSCPRSQAEAELESRQSDVRAPLPPAYNHQDLRLNIVLMWVEPTGPFFHAFFSLPSFYCSSNCHINILPYKIVEKIPLWENVLSSESFLPASFPLPPPITVFIL